MTRAISYLTRAKRFGRDQAGATAILFGLAATGLIGMLGASVDVGHALAAKRQLDNRVQADALMGARALSTPNATSASVGAIVTSWNGQHPLASVTGTNTTTALTCITATANLPACNGANPNGVKVTQTGKVSTYFLKLFGYPEFNLASSATAAAAGGAGTPMQVMFVLDSTGSMNNDDPACTVPGIAHPTRYQCATYSIQQVMLQLQPSLTSVGLMAFPGTGTQYNPSTPCGTQPSSVPYLTTNIHYQIGASLDATYKLATGLLNPPSPMVRAVGNNAASPSVVGCQTAKGGQQSYGAEVLTKAQAALPIIAGTQNVIIFLSDGDFNASQAAIASDGTKFFSTASNCAIAGSPNSATNLPGILKQIVGSLSKPRLVLN